MAYARACQESIACGEAYSSASQQALLKKRRALYALLPDEAKAGLGWGPRTNLQTIMGRYGQIDAA